MVCTMGGRGLRRVETVDEDMGLESLFGNFGEVIHKLTIKAELPFREIRKLKNVVEENEAVGATLNIGDTKLKMKFARDSASYKI
ncbi:hypothetical protein BTVI_35054 [Pitangus sulphuratus]|nr:hypothetical protein BTVI_35054 [Pitangus sulphuratus]